MLKKGIFDLTRNLVLSKMKSSVIKEKPDKGLPEKGYINRIKSSTLCWYDICDVLISVSMNCRLNNP